jgi:hypothetical protein
MDNQSLNNRIEREWDLEQGFLGKLRQGNLDIDSFNRLKEVLESIDFKDDVLVDRRMISLLWYIPLFMSWQREKFEDDDKKLQFLDHASNEVTSILEKILGVP